jgi:hypothetical protein
LPGGGFAAPIAHAATAGNCLAVRDLSGAGRPDLVTVGDGILSVHVTRWLSP